MSSPGVLVKIEGDIPESMSSEIREELVVRARGLPWSATGDDIAEFFEGCNIRGGKGEGVHFTFTDGRPSGECFVEMMSNDDVEKALTKNNKFMGKRYVEVFKSKVGEMDWVCKRMGHVPDRSRESVVRLRGLPFGCEKEDVAQFFTGLEIVPNGITITLDDDGKTTGDAFVEFVCPDTADQALKKHKETMGHRYIEIFKSSKQEIKYVVAPKPRPLMSTRPGPYDRMAGFGGGSGGGGNGSSGGGGGGSGGGGGASMGRFARGNGFERRFRGRGNFGGPVFGGGYGGDFNGFGGSGGVMRGNRGGRGGGSMRGNFGFGGRGGFSGGGFDNQQGTTGHAVHMRGLPYAAKEADIKQFFMPLNPVSVRMEVNFRQQFNGEADVDFATHADASAAMAKDRHKMGHRYIELFLRSEPDGSEEGQWGSGSGFGSNSGGTFGNTGGNFSSGGSNFGGGGNFGDNSGNFGNFSGGGGSNNFTNQSGTGGFNNQATTGSGFSNNQQGNFGNSQGSSGNFGGQTGGGSFGGQNNSGNFGNQGSGFGGGNTGVFGSTNAGAFNAQTAFTGSGGYSANQGSNSGYNTSGFGNQMSAGMNTGYSNQSGGYGAQQGNQQQQQQQPQQQQQQQQQQQTNYADNTYGNVSGGSFFTGMQKQDSSGTSTGMVSYPGYQ